MDRVCTEDKKRKKEDMPRERKTSCLQDSDIVKIIWYEDYI